ncbi:hypothetical protein [Hugenholtzia roseola]|nr:hypothetical protein [Hugenholtzia roseola]
MKIYSKIVVATLLVALTVLASCSYKTCPTYAKNQNQAAAKNY